MEKPRINNELENISVPENLELRLSARIDLWDTAEHEERCIIKSKNKYRTLKRTWKKSIIAASIIIISVCGLLFLLSESKGRTDTYENPRIAYIETKKVLDILVENVSLCQQEIMKVRKLSTQKDSIID